MMHLAHHRCCPNGVRLMTPLSTPSRRPSPILPHWAFLTLLLRLLSMSMPAMRAWPCAFTSHSSPAPSSPSCPNQSPLLRLLPSLTRPFHSISMMVNSTSCALTSSPIASSLTHINLWWLETPLYLTVSR